MEIKKTPQYLAFESFVQCAIMERNPIHYQHLSPIKYLNEFCTFKFGLQRQSGHTLNSLLILPKYFKSILFLMPTYSMERIYKNYLDDLGQNSDYKNLFESSISKRDYWHQKISFSSVKCILNHLVDARDIDCVVVEPFSLVTNKEYDTILHEVAAPLLIRNPKKFSLFLLE